MRSTAQCCPSARGKVRGGARAMGRGRTQGTLVGAPVSVNLGVIGLF